MEDNLKIRVHREPWDYSVAVLLFSEEFGGEKSVVKNVTLEKCESGQFINPTFRMTEEAAQALFNSLWQEGFRPKDGTGNSGHIAALSNHLEDMRKLVFKPTTALQPPTEG